MNWERGVLLRKQMANGFVKNYMVLNVYFKTGSKWIFHNGLPMTYNKAFRIHIMEVMIRNNTFDAFNCQINKLIHHIHDLYTK